MKIKIEVILGVIFVFIFLFILLKKNEPYKDINNGVNEMHQPLKTCTSGNIGSRIGGKSKCFACEREACSRSAGNTCAIANEHPLRYYSSDPIPGLGYPKAGYVMY